MLLLVNISHADITLNFYSTSLSKLLEALSMGVFTYSSLINSKYVSRGKLNKSKICRNGILKTEKYYLLDFNLFFSLQNLRENCMDSLKRNDCFGFS